MSAIMVRMTLKDARRARKWTQAELATRSDVKQQEISRIESGQVKKPAHKTVMALCRALDRDPLEIDEFHNGGRR